MKLIQIATLAAVTQCDAEIVVVYLLIVVSYFWRISKESLRHAMLSLFTFRSDCTRDRD